MAEQNGTLFSRETFRVLAGLISRAGLASRLGVSFNGARHIHDALGYKARLEYADFKARYYRGDIAQRIVKAYPEATWSQTPSIKEDDEAEVETPFEQDLAALLTKIELFSLLERADILNNIGQYSLLFLGLRGQGAALAEPATLVRGPDDLLYVTPYSEEWASIERFDDDPGSPLFGRASHYKINFARNRDPRQTQRSAGTVIVHASRVIHVAEDILDDEVYGLPRLESIYDRLDDLAKVVGASAEIFWKNAKGLMVLNLDKDATLTDPAGLTEEVDEMMHGFRNYLRVQGMNVDSLAPPVASPEKHVEMLLDLIAATIGIPKRILLGSERGQLASMQDEAAWLQRVQRRQQRFAEPGMLRPMLDRLIALGVLRAPAVPYEIVWPNLKSLSEEQRADVALKIAQALNTYAPGMADIVVPLPEFREAYLGRLPYPEYPLDDIPANDRLDGEDDPADDDPAAGDDPAASSEDTP